MKLFCDKCKKVSKPIEKVSMAVYDCACCGARNEVIDVSIQEWLGFNYRDYLHDIVAFIDKDIFENLLARNKVERLAGRLTAGQIKKVKNIFIESFNKGASIREISDRLLKEAKLPKRYLMRDGKLLKRNGEKILAFDKRARSVHIARTESTRLANEGSHKHYRKGGVERYRWIATLSDRTCPICEDLNGQIFEMGERVLPPAHGLCRCTIAPITELD